MELPPELAQQNPCHGASGDGPNSGGPCPRHQVTQHLHRDNHNECHYGGEQNENRDKHCRCPISNIVHCALPSRTLIYIAGADVWRAAAWIGPTLSTQNTISLSSVPSLGRWRGPTAILDEGFFEAARPATRGTLVIGPGMAPSTFGSLGSTLSNPPTARLSLPATGSNTLADGRGLTAAGGGEHRARANRVRGDTPRHAYLLPDPATPLIERSRARKVSPGEETHRRCRGKRTGDRNQALFFRGAFQH